MFRADVKLSSFVPRRFKPFSPHGEGAFRFATSNSTPLREFPRLFRD